MLTFFILGIALLIGFLLVARWYASADPKVALKALRWGAVGLFVVIAAFFIFTGRLSWAFMALPVLLPWLMRARSVARTAKAFSRMSQAQTGNASGETTDVETRFFQMTLDHDSGDMSGTVLEGRHEGQSIEQLTTAQLIELLQICQAEDMDSARVLEAYLDRNRPDWHDHVNTGDGDGDTGHGSHKTAMDRAEALLVLGLTEEATTADIKEAHRKLISGMHPDHGGSDYLASQINQAKDILLGDKK